MYLYLFSLNILISLDQSLISFDTFYLFPTEINGEKQKENRNNKVNKNNKFIMTINLVVKILTKSCPFLIWE